MDLSRFNRMDFLPATKAFFKDLQVPVNYLADEPTSARTILKDAWKDNAAFNLMQDVYFLGMVDDAAFAGDKSMDASKIQSDYDGVLIFGVTLSERENNRLPTRSQLAQIARAFNREYFYTPVIVVFKYGRYLGFANTQRLKYKQEWREGEKAGKVSLLRDIDINNPHTGHLRILNDLKIPETGKNKVDSFAKLYAYWQDVFNVNILNKKFYQELSNWYFWAVKEVAFPSEPTKADEHLKKIDFDILKQEHNAKNVIRLLTRFLFVWFVKEKKLIPEELFDVEFLKKELLKDISPVRGEGLLKEANTESVYYKAILQNLFFASLNCPIEPSETGDNRKRGFRLKENFGQHRDANYLMRYQDQFKNPEKFLELINSVVPFLNGGLFECLDNKTDKIYIDGFSDNLVKPHRLIVPDYLFFGFDREVDLSGVVGISSKAYINARVKGLIPILESYKFTVAENTPIEEDVALDPELLGKVFENLLASYNPETKTTARKQTGSFYTPREIVNYMVDESLIAYLKNNVKNWGIEAEKLDQQLHELLSYDEINPFANNENLQKQIIHALDNCKILDPACGSGAFPMGVLQKMVHVLQKVDPDNKYWQELQLNKAVKDTEKAFALADKKEREQKLIEINEAFDEKINDPDYARKLFLVENCIYGVDIQPIATQISKLRFFISLVVDQKVDKAKPNFGIRALPNLETKFVAANTLIGIKKHEVKLTLFDNQEIKELELELKKVRHRLFSAKTPATKRRLRDKDKEIREKIGNLLKEHGWGNETARQLAAWDPYDQNASSPFFDTEWMFGVSDGFDVVIGNPPYVEARNSALFPDDQKKLYQKNLKNRWGIKGQHITRGSDLLIYFFEFGLKYLNTSGINAFITQNAWLSTDYGKKFQDFLLKLDIDIKIDESNVKHFCDANGPNINTVISFFINTPKLNKVRISSVDITNAQNDNNISNVTDYDFGDNLLKYKWGTLFKSPNFIIDLFKKLENVGSQTGYSIGQGLNISKNCFVPIFEKIALEIDEKYLTPIITSADGAQFVVHKTNYLIVINGNVTAKNLLKNSGYETVKITSRRLIPALVLPRGLGRYFCAYNTCRSYSSSFVEVYTDDSKIKENVWIFMNSTIGYLIREITGRSNLGGGMLKAEATDLKLFPLYYNFEQVDKINSILNKAHQLESVGIKNLLDLPVIKEINSLVYNHIGITMKNRNKIDEYFKELVKRRESKAKG